jgi:hypothetical protein
MGKRWHIAFADYSWGQSTRDAYVEQIKKAGGEIVGTTGIPLGTADMTPFLSKITGNFDGLFGIFFGKDGVTIGNQAFDLGLTKKYKWAGDGAIAEATNLPALGNKIEGFIGINRYIPVLDGPLNTPGNKRFIEEAQVRLKPLREFRSLLEEPGKFLMIPSQELTHRFAKAPVHINVINIRDMLQPIDGADVAETVRVNLGTVADQQKRTGWRSRSDPDRTHAGEIHLHCHRVRNRGSAAPARRTQGRVGV